MLRVPLNDLKRSWLANDPEVVDACRSVLQGGWYVQGPEHDAFERELAAFLGVEHAMGVGNGTDALRLSLRAMACGPGSVVLTVANAGGYASVAAASLGARCRYVDVDERSLVVTPECVAKELLREVHMVVVTHLYGNVVDVPSIVALCREAGVPLIEDCAQAIGGKYGSQFAGTMGTAAAFSFYPTKNLGAPGDAGAVTSNSTNVAQAIARLRNYGWDRRYRIEVEGGGNSRLDEMQAAVLRIGLRAVAAQNEARLRILNRYRASVTGSKRWMATGEGCETTAHLAVLVTEGLEDRRDITAFMTSRGIATDIHYPVLDTQQRGLPDPVGSATLDVSRDAQERILTIPCFPAMNDEEIETVVAALDEISS